MYGMAQKIWQKKKNRSHSRQKDKRKAFGAHLAKQR